ncbi:NPCBM/NEW2 domain-containing protein [Candidatus Gottesmanbacteria bacterium]|nr:NPCBM/NEW2 domain-containing protein [Candidatus Gottesmanbacteria bacterium]
MRNLLYLLLIGLLIRLIFIPNTGFIADISFWKSWGLAARDHGIVWTAHNTNINYPPGFIYILWYMGESYSLFADPQNFNEFWDAGNLLFLAISKFPAILSDLGIAILIYIFSKNILKDEKQKESRLPLILTGLFLFNPVVILDSAIWGQVESFGMLFTILTVILILKGKPSLAIFIFVVGCLMKLQNIIYIPLIYLFIFRYHGFDALIKSIATSLLAFIITVFPFLMANDIERVLLLLTVNNDYFPWLSLHAHNPWWILSGGTMISSDKILVLGIANAKQVGLILFAGIYLLLMILLWKSPNPKNFIISLGISIFAFFLFTTQSHERYSYPAIVWLLFYIPFIREIRWKKYAFFLFALLTSAIFFNMHEGLVANYPENGFAPLTAITNQLTNNINSVFMIILLFLLLPFIFRQISYLYLFIPAIFISLALFGLNAQYLLKGKIFLSSLKPTSTSLGFGVLQKDRSVNSFAGPKSWNFLSSEYFFYEKGFGTHANSLLTFDLNRKFSRLKTDVGVDSEGGTDASVVFKIHGDDKLLYESEKMGRFDFPRHIDVNLKGVKTLILEVTDGDDGINNDHADWLNPILYK